MQMRVRRWRGTRLRLSQFYLCFLVDVFRMHGWSDLVFVKCAYVCAAGVSSGQQIRNRTFVQNESIRVNGAFLSRI